MRRYVFSRILIFLSLFLFIQLGVKAQNVRNDINEASVLMRDGKYSEAYSLLQRNTDKQAEEYCDTCVAYLNYYKGSCLYYLKKYEEAISCLKKGIQVMDKFHFKNCDYLELLYGIGACYKELNDYAKAEVFLRRTIIRGTYMGQNCAIREKTYDELADLYVKIGKPDLADYCSIRKAQESVMEFMGDEDKQIDVLFEVAESYAKHGNEVECIKTYKEILDLIKSKQGRVNDDYLLYARLLSSNYYYVFNKPFEASEINKEIIEIGKEFKTFKEIVAISYDDYLCYLASLGKKDSVEIILPEAVNYCTSTIYKSIAERNLYEDIGLAFYDAHEFDEAAKYLELEWKGKTANSILALTFLGNYYYQRNPEKALAFFKTAESHIINGLQVNDDTKQAIFQNLIFLNERLRNYQEAIKYAEILEPIIIKSNNDDQYLSLLHLWAADCINANRPDKAKEVISKCEPLLERVSNDVKIGAYSNMGFVYLKLDQYDEAIKKIEKGIELARREEGEKSQFLATLYHNLGRSYMLLNNYEKALTYLNMSKALQIELEGGVSQRTTDYINECLEK